MAFKTTPCSPGAVAGVDRQSARLLCAEGTLQGTPDGGASWSLLGRLDQGVSVAFSSPSAGWALARRDGCPAAVVRTTNGGSAWEQVACVEGGRPRAIAVDGETVVVQAGDQVSRSTDDGASFSPLG